MTDKAYIVVNEQQEREVLEKLEREGLTWCAGDKPTEYVPTKWSGALFPFVLFVGNSIKWNMVSKLEDEEIVFDGRKEENMSEKYVVSQEFMDGLEEWKADIRHEWFDKKADGKWLNSADISDLESITEDWWLDPETSYKESNNRLIAILRWVNGGDVFEVEKPKKWVIRSKDRTEQGSYLYVMLDISHGVKKPINFWDKDIATRFDTKEEAESWANAHQEVRELIEVGE